MLVWRRITAQVALDDRIMEDSVMQMTTIMLNYLNRTWGI
jgi:hypothetical protein